MNVPPPKRHSISLSKAGLVDSYSVLKVNKFRKDSRHILQLDIRTNSLIIKDANDIPKVELNAQQVMDVKKNDKNHLVLEIVYRVGTQVFSKKYRFQNIQYLAAFYRKCKRHLLAGRSTSSLSLGRKRNSQTGGNADAVVPQNEYMPKPLDTSKQEIAEFLTDTCDALSSNLLRLWEASPLKAQYEIDEHVEVNPKVRLREQLRLFMGATHTDPQSKVYQTVSYVMSEELIKCVYELGYVIEESRQSVSSRSVEQWMEADADVHMLVQKLAVHSNEMWSKLSWESQYRRELAAGMHSRKLTTSSSMDLPPPPPQDNGSSSIGNSAGGGGGDSPPPPPPPSSTMSSSLPLSMTNHSPLSGSSSGDSILRGESVLRSPITSSKSSTSLLSSSTSTPTNNLARTPTQPVHRRKMKLAPFLALDVKLQAAHLNDAKELLRTVTENGFCVRKVMRRGNHKHTFSLPDGAALRLSK